MGSGKSKIKVARIVYRLEARQYPITNLIHTLENRTKEERCLSHDEMKVIIHELKQLRNGIQDDSWDAYELLYQ